MMKNYLLYLLIIFTFILTACESHDDGTRFISEITEMTAKELATDLYPGKFKIEAKDKDGNYDWFYTDDASLFVAGDSVVTVPFAQRAAFTLLQTTNAELAATLEHVQNAINSKDSSINSLNGQLADLTGQLADANNFKEQVKALLVEAEVEDAAVKKDIVNTESTEVVKQ